MNRSFTQRGSSRLLIPVLATLSILAFSSSAQAACQAEEAAAKALKKSIQKTIATALNKPQKNARARLKSVIACETNLTNMLNGAESKRKRLESAQRRFDVVDSKLRMRLVKYGVHDFGDKFTRELGLSRQMMLDELRSLEGAAFAGAYQTCSTIPLCQTDTQRVRKNTVRNAEALQALLAGADAAEQARLTITVKSSAKYLQRAAERRNSPVLICSLDTRCSAEEAIRLSLIRSVELLDALEGKTSDIENLACSRAISELGLTYSRSKSLLKACQVRATARASLRRAENDAQLQGTAQEILVSEEESRKRELKSLGVKRKFRKMSAREELNSILGRYKAIRPQLKDAQKKLRMCKN